jgi:integrase/recombinase XerC
MHLQDALARFALQLEADGRSAHTIGQYRRAIGLLARWLDRERLPTDLDGLTPEHLARFLVSTDVRTNAHGAPKATVTVNATRTSLRVFFAHAHEAGHARSNPARLVRRAICSPPPPKALSDAEVERLLRVLEQGSRSLEGALGLAARRDRTLIRLLLGTGIRIGSALALDTSDVDLAAGVLRLRETKRDKPERVFVSKDAAAALAELISTLPASGGSGSGRAHALFCGPQGQRLAKRHAQRRITLWLDRAGLGEGTPHSLRHTFATRLLRRTGDLFLVKTAMRHASIASTAVYLSVSDERLRAAVGG